MRIDEVIGEIHVAFAADAVPGDHGQQSDDAECDTAQPAEER